MQNIENCISSVLGVKSGSSLSEAKILSYMVDKYCRTGPSTRVKADFIRVEHVMIYRNIGSKVKLETYCKKKY